MTRSIAFAVGVILALVAVSPPARPDTPNQCWSRCSDCVHRCKSNRDCEANCTDSNASCCEAHDTHAIYHMCGCSN